MKRNWLLISAVALLLVAAIVMVYSSNQPVTTQQKGRSTSEALAAHDHSPAKTTAHPVPAHFAAPPSRASLAPTLDPASFSGITRDAYRAVREIPVTIAQLPCYCHCDQGFGHKSLYSCFEDDHAAHCAVCVQEALMALKLEKEQKMTPAQIRDTIIAQYAQ